MPTEELDLYSYLRHQLPEDSAQVQELHDLRAQLAEAQKQYTTAEQWRRKYCDKLAAAEQLAYRRARFAGWSVILGQSITSVLKEMRSKHCDERSYADLTASGGLPETQELHPEIASLRAQGGEAQKALHDHDAGDLRAAARLAPHVPQAVDVARKAEESNDA